MRFWMLLVIGGCSGAAVQKPEPVSPAPPVPIDAPDGEITKPPPSKLPSPQELYEICEERVESPRMEGECASDADCTKAGCSQEVCTTVSNATDVTTTCEGKLCFAILDSCGCIDGECSWSILDAFPESKLPKKVPLGSLPVGGPEGD